MQRRRRIQIKEKLIDFCKSQSRHTNNKYKKNIQNIDYKLPYIYIFTVKQNSMYRLTLGHFINNKNNQFSSIIERGSTQLNCMEKLYTIDCILRNGSYYIHKAIDSRHASDNEMV